MSRMLVLSAGLCVLLPSLTARADEAGSHTANIIVQVPADAALSFEGTPTRSRTPVRWFVTPPLVPGQDYYYTVEAQVFRGGQWRTERRDIAVRAGDTTRLNMLAAFRTQAAATSRAPFTPGSPGGSTGVPNNFPSGSFPQGGFPSSSFSSGSAPSSFQQGGVPSGSFQQDSFPSNGSPSSGFQSSNFPPTGGQPGGFSPNGVSSGNFQPGGSFQPGGGFPSGGGNPSGGDFQSGAGRASPTTNNSPRDFFAPPPNSGPAKAPVGPRGPRR